MIHNSMKVYSHSINILMYTLCSPESVDFQGCSLRWINNPSRNSASAPVLSQIDKTSLRDNSFDKPRNVGEYSLVCTHSLILFNSVSEPEPGATIINIQIYYVLLSSTDRTTDWQCLLLLCPAHYQVSVGSD